MSTKQAQPSRSGLRPKRRAAGAPIQSQKSSKLVDISLLVVIFFGLCGAFISNVINAPKVHYGPLLLGVFVVVLVAKRKDTRVQYLVALVLIGISPLFAAEGNDYLSYFSTMVLPIFWFCAGPLISPTRVARGLAALSLFLVFGTVIEIMAVFPDLFPYIGVRLGDEAARRYGSFAMNPLALGYIGAVAGALALCIPSPGVRWVAIGASVVLLALANSRGGMVTFAISAAIYWALRRRPRPRSSRKTNGMRVLISIFVVVSMFAVVATNPRLSSIFDWTGDEGNLGRLNQWGYCLLQISSSPLSGKGAGAMSPIGIGDDPYIEEGFVKSCDSTLLKLGVEYNAVTAIFYFVLILYLMKKTIAPILAARRSAARKVAEPEVSAAVAVACSIFLQQFMNQTLESVWIGAVFFSLLGYAFSRVGTRLSPAKQPKPVRTDVSVEAPQPAPIMGKPIGSS